MLLGPLMEVAFINKVAPIPVFILSKTCFSHKNLIRFLNIKPGSSSLSVCIRCFTEAVPGVVKGLLRSGLRSLPQKQGRDQDTLGLSFCKSKGGIA